MIGCSKIKETYPLPFISVPIILDNGGLRLVFYLSKALFVLFGLTPGNMKPPAVFSNPCSLNFRNYYASSAFCLLIS